MNRPGVTSNLIAGALCLLLGYAANAAGQQPATPGGQNVQGPLVLEPLTNGVIIAPDFKVTKLDGKVRTLAGAYAGVVKDDRLFIGGGLYSVADGKSGSALTYGGVVAGWFTQPDRPVSVSVKSLFGLGQLSQSLAISPPPDPHDVERFGPVDRTFRFTDPFMVAEPELDLQVKLTGRIRLNAGVGYRAISARNHGLEVQARGPTGTVSVQIKLK